MSIFHRDFVIFASEAIGISKLPDDVITALTQDVEYRLREVIQESKKFMRHSRRNFLSTQDVNSALKVKNIEPLFGFSAPRPAVFKKADSQLYYLDDEELDFDKVLSAPLPKLPLDICLTAHWLAIEGVQPAIPQNPVPSMIQEEKKSLAAILNVNPLSSSSIPSTGTAAGANGTYTMGTAASTTLAPTTIKSATPPTLQVKDVISKELQLYYEKITEAILHPEDEIRDIALGSIGSDPGLQGLLPYFLKFIQERITKNLKHLPTLMLMMTFLHHLLSNPHFFLEPYLHQVIPILLTTLLGKQLCLDPTTEDHWSLRQSSAHLLSTLLFRFTDSYPTLLPRVTRTLLMTLLDPLKPLTSKVGSILGLSLLGNEVIEASLVPNVHLYLSVFASMQINHQQTDVAEEANETADKNQENEEQQRVISKLLEVYARALAKHHQAKQLSIPDSKPAPSPTSNRMEVDEPDEAKMTPPLCLDEERVAPVGHPIDTSKPEGAKEEEQDAEKEDLVNRYGPILGQEVFKSLRQLKAQSR